MQKLKAVTLAVITLTGLSAWGGQIFVSGHDPDFHAFEGPNLIGAQDTINVALDFARNGDTKPILVIQTDLSNVSLGDHIDSLNGLISSGYTAGATPGNHFVVVNATAFATTNLANYSAIFAPSDHGGTLTEADIIALDADSANIIRYLNAGGGLVAFAEDGFHTGGNSAKLYGFLPFLVSSTAASQFESGNVLTPFGASLGLTTSDINGNFSHNVFTSTGGMNVVDTTPNGDIMSLAFKGQIGSGGVTTPEPSSLLLLGSGILGLAGVIRRKLSV